MVFLCFSHEVPTHKSLLRNGWDSVRHTGHHPPPRHSSGSCDSRATRAVPRRNSPRPHGRSHCRCEQRPLRLSQLHGAGMNLNLHDWVIFSANVNKYSIHGSYGYWNMIATNSTCHLEWCKDLVYKAQRNTWENI